jgi:hypothetical protein
VEQLGRVGHVHQDPSTDDGVEIVPRIEPPYVAVVERHVAPATGVHPCPRDVEDLLVHVDSDDFSLGSHQFGEQQGDVTGTTPELEDLHARRDARRLEKLASQRTVDLVLKDQPPSLGVGTPQRIAVGHGRTTCDGHGLGAHALNSILAAPNMAIRSRRSACPQGRVTSSGGGRRGCTDTGASSVGGERSSVMIGIIAQRLSLGVSRSCSITDQVQLAQQARSKPPVSGGATTCTRAGASPRSGPPLRRRCSEQSVSASSRSLPSPCRVRVSSSSTRKTARPGVMTGFRAMPHRTPAIVKPTGNR